MMLAVTEMLAQANDGTDTVVAGQVQEGLARIQQLVQAAVGDGSDSRVLYGNGSAVAAVAGNEAAASAGVTIESDQPGEAFGTADVSIIATVARATTLVTGGSGADWIAAYAMIADQRDVTDAGVEVSGGEGDDRIRAVSSGTLSVDSGAGDDTIDARFNAYGLIHGGDGNDRIDASGSLGTVDGGAGNDIITLRGQSVGATGGEGDDTIAGADWAIGGTGNDMLELSNARISGVTFARGDGADTIVLSPVDDGRSSVSMFSASISQGGSANESHDIWLDFGGPDEIKMELPQPGDAGYGLAHTVVTLGGMDLHEVQASLDGTDLTVSIAGTEDSITIRNYQPGRVTFVFDDRARGNSMQATRHLPGLTG
ncbi:MAG: calcium-binding protein [Acetobacteraceae bacterium]